MGTSLDSSPSVTWPSGFFSSTLCVLNSAERVISVSWSSFHFIEELVITLPEIEGYWSTFVRLFTGSNPRYVLSANKRPATTRINRSGFWCMSNLSSIAENIVVDTSSVMSELTKDTPSTNPLSGCVARMRSAVLDNCERLYSPADSDSSLYSIEEKILDQPNFSFDSAASVVFIKTTSGECAIRSCGTGVSAKRGVHFRTRCLPSCSTLRIASPRSLNSSLIIHSVYLRGVCESGKFNHFPSWYSLVFPLGYSIFLAQSRMSNPRDELGNLVSSRHSIPTIIYFWINRLLASSDSLWQNFAAYRKKTAEVA